MKITIYVIHGYTANSHSNWFPWLKAQLDSDTVEVKVLDMPNSSNPLKEKWLSYLDKNVSVLDKDTIFIGHSLGCITSLTYLQNKKIPIKGIVLVSGFVEKSPLPQLNGFMTTKLDYTLLKELIPARISITAKDDDIVPCEYAVEMSKKIMSELFILEKGKHFLDKDGYYDLPIVLEKIKNIL